MSRISGGFHIDTGNLARALQVWQDSPIFSLETWREFGRAFSSSVQLLGPEDLKWLQGSGSAVSDTSPQALLAGASSGISGTHSFVPAALASSDASALRLNTAFRGLSSSIENDMANSLTDITTGTKSAGQGFADFETAAVRAVEQVMIKMMIVEPLMRSLQDLFSGGTCRPSASIRSRA